MSWTIENQTTSSDLALVSEAPQRIHWGEGFGSFIEISIAPEFKASQVTVSLGDILLAYHTTAGADTYVFRGKVEDIIDNGDNVSYWTVRAPGLLKACSDIKVAKSYGAGVDIEDAIIPDLLALEGVSPTGEEIFVQELSDSGISLSSYIAVGTIRQVISDLADIAHYRIFEGYNLGTDQTRLMWGLVGEGGGKSTFEKGIDGQVGKRRTTSEGITNWVTIEGTIEILGYREQVVWPAGPPASVVLTYTPEGSVQAYNLTPGVGVPFPYTGGTQDAQNDYWVDRTTSTVTFTGAVAPAPVAGDIIEFVYDSQRPIFAEQKDINSIKKYRAKREELKNVEITFGADVEQLMKDYVESFSYPLEEIILRGPWNDAYIPNSWIFIHDKTRMFSRNYLVKSLDIDLFGEVTIRVGEVWMDFQSWVKQATKRQEGKLDALAIRDQETLGYMTKYIVQPKIETSMKVEYSGDAGTTWKTYDNLKGGGFNQDFLDAEISGIKDRVIANFAFFTPGDADGTPEATRNVAMDNEWIGPVNREVLVMSYNATTQTLTGSVTAPYTDVPPKNYVGKILKEYGIFDGNVNGDGLQLRVVLRADQDVTKTAANQMIWDIIIELSIDQDVRT